MPDFPVASSNRMVLEVCAIRPEDNKSKRARHDFTLVSSCSDLGGFAGHVRWRRGLQERHRDGIFRSCFWPGMASDADALLAAPHPEISRLTLQGLTGGVEQFDLERLLVWDLHKKGSVFLNWCCTQKAGLARVVAGVEPNGANRTRCKRVFRRVRVQAKQICIRPVMQAGGMPVGNRALRQQHWPNQIQSRIRQHRM